MSKPVTNSLKWWRYLFLALEAIVLGTFLVFSAAERFWGLRAEPTSPMWTAILVIILMLSWLFLLIVSPFFLKKLRWIALSGWLIAFGILLVCALMPAL